MHGLDPLRTAAPSAKGAAEIGRLTKTRVIWLQACLARIGGGVEVIALLMGGLCLGIVFVTLLLQVLYRYVLFLPLNWSEEAARFGLVWLGMLSAVIAARHGLHFTFRFVIIFLPEAARRWLRIGANLLIIFFLCVLAVQARVYLGIVDNQTAPATGINLAVPYSSILVGSVLMIAIYAIEALDALLAMFSGVRYSEIETQEQTTYEQLRSWRDKGRPRRAGAERQGNQVGEEAN